MSSGFPGSDFYSGMGGGSAMNNTVRVQYRPQLGGVLVDPSSSTVIPQHPTLAKRPLTELDRQQLQNLLLLRSVKQRTHLTSPIYPLPPIDLSSASPEISTTSSSCTSSARLGVSLFQQRQQQQQQPNNLNSCNFSFSPIPNRFCASESEEKKMRNRLQELERQLLDDDDDDEGGGGGNGSDVSVVTSSWSETMQNLITPKPLPTSPTSSSSSCTTTTSSSPSPKQLLLDSAAAISEGKTEAAAGILGRLKQVSNPRGGDSEQRLTAYMVSALLSRINPTERGGGPSIAELCSGEHMFATQMLYEASPCFKLGFMAANLAILEATRDQPKIHIVDFDIGQGSQYLTLLHALAERQSVKPTVKITALTDPNSINGGNISASCNGLQVVRDRLTKLAERVGVSLRFNVVCCRASDLKRESIGCDSDESLAVNFAFRLYKMADESVSTANPRDELLRVVKGLSPKVVTLVEQEMNANTAPFLTRFGETLAYYRALFESLDATMTRDASERVRVEECLARKAANVVGREGRDRIERCEVFGKWRARMGMAGFEARPLGSHVADSMRVRVNRTHPGFFVKEETGGICFGWMGRILTVTSAWR